MVGGRLWVGTSEGLFSFEAGANGRWERRGPALNGFDLGAVAVGSDGRVFAGTKARGLPAVRVIRPVV